MFTIYLDSRVRKFCELKDTVSFITIALSPVPKPGPGTVGAT